MNLLFIMVFLFSVSVTMAQDKKELKAQQQKLEKSNNYIFQGNELIQNDDFVSAEMEYRKAISEQSSNVAGSYNLGNSYFEKGNYDEALFRHTQAAEKATSKSEKHKAYHNIGNILMQKKLCKEAVEAYKNALRNDPSDDETRYNLALAKDCAEQQQDEDQQQEKEGEKENEDENQDDQKNEDEKNQDDQQKNDENEEKKDGDDKKDDQGKPKDEKEKEDNKGKEQESQGKPQPRPGQLSPQQIKNLLEAMNNQEQKVQKKINAEKQKGQPIKTEKDW
ncbi:tetratricopeptide repeat protein [Psychroserpens sp. XS_ASV72]|uniref:tetratricopeptide repeat protein n=1 Tax=Psychroserpens sp. XS_ASV72 TaxID=3241293 RepID=UPI003519A740